MNWNSFVDFTNPAVGGTISSALGLLGGGGVSLDYLLRVWFWFYQRT